MRVGTTAGRMTGRIVSATRQQQAGHPMRPQDEQDHDEDGGAERPSKGARKRAAHAAQDLGEELIELKESELAALGLPEHVADAIREARRLTSRAALVRQRQYIGKLMRSLDLEPIRAALAAKHERSSLDAQRFKRIEAWRNRLMSEGAAAVAELARWHPDLDQADWTRRAAEAQAARDAGNPAPARELFRALRELLG